MCNELRTSPCAQIGWLYLKPESACSLWTLAWNGHTWSLDKGLARTNSWRPLSWLLMAQWRHIKDLTMFHRKCPRAAHLGINHWAQNLLPLECELAFYSVVITNWVYAYSSRTNYERIALVKAETSFTRTWKLGEMRE